MEDKREGVQLQLIITVHSKLIQSIWFRVKIRLIRINKLKNHQQSYRKKNMTQSMYKMKHLMECSKE